MNSTVSRILRRIATALLIIFFITICGIGGAGYWLYLRFSRDLPDFASVEDYRPPAVTKVFSREGTLMAEFYKERRYPTRLSDIPEIVRDCFIAAEDANFYKHPGIDFLSIARAAIRNFQSGSSKQGGSTITQQVVKNLLLTPAKSFSRKFREAILSYRLEKRLSKDGILEIYLNQIFFGNNAYGVSAAAQAYFHKDIKDLDLAEGAMLAALPKAPSRYSPLVDMPRAKRRQKYVLDRMVEAGFIREEEATRAFNEYLNFYKASAHNIYHAPFYVTEVRRLLSDKWNTIDIDVDGLSIYTAADLEADELGIKYLRKGLQTVDKRRGWRGPVTKMSTGGQQAFLEKFGSQIGETISPDAIIPALVVTVKRNEGIAEVLIQGKTERIDLRNVEWAKHAPVGAESKIPVQAEKILQPGDVIEVSLDTSEKNPGDGQKFKLDQTPDIEGAITLIEPYTGEVMATVGGYSYERSQFNRATQSQRQPGSAFKPIIYLAAIDGFSYTPATIVDDRPMTFKVGDEYWSPQNFDEKYLGPITLQAAIEKSRNLISAEIVSRIGIDPVIRYATRLGIKSPLGRHLSLALGVSEVNLLELTRAYGVFAAKGELHPSIFVKKIVDRDGRELYNSDNDINLHWEQAISPQSAFIMAHMMKGVVERGTAIAVKPINRPVAGKTGTTNDVMDAWFVGYTPEWACGIWVGFDQKKQIGEKQTGGVVAAPIWHDYMKDFLDRRDDRIYERLVSEVKSESERSGTPYVEPVRPVPADFEVPPKVKPYWIDRGSGAIVDPGTQGALLEYFPDGVEPKKFIPAEVQSEPSADSYLDSPDL